MWKESQSRSKRNSPNRHLEKPDVLKRVVSPRVPTISVSDSSEYDEILVNRREETKKLNGSSNVFSGCVFSETDTPVPVPLRPGGKSADLIIHRRSAHFPEEQAVKQNNALRKSFSFRATMSKINIFNRSNPNHADKQEKFDDNIETKILNASVSNLLNILSYSADDVSTIGVQTQTLEKQNTFVPFKTDSSIAMRLRSSFKTKKNPAYERSGSFQFLAHSGDPFSPDFDQRFEVDSPPTNHEYNNEEEYGVTAEKPVALFFENNIYESICSLNSESSSSYIKEMDTESEHSKRSNRVSYIVNIFDTHGERQDIHTLEESHFSDTDVRQSTRRKNGLEEVRKKNNRRSISLTNVSTSTVLKESLLYPSRIPEPFFKSLSKCVEKHSQQASPRYSPKIEVSPSYAFLISIHFLYFIIISYCLILALRLSIIML